MGPFLPTIVTKEKLALVEAQLIAKGRKKDVKERCSNLGSSAKKQVSLTGLQ